MTERQKMLAGEHTTVAVRILPGVRIGSRAVVGAGIVVTRDVPDGVFAAGNPCRVIREITK
jgi:maltose O-acetyltransferase